MAGEGLSDDELARLMATAQGAPPEPEDGEAPMAFDQSLIDSMLGFTRAELPGDTVGPRALLHPATVPHERAPMLEAAFERLVRSLKSSLRNLASDNVEVTLSE